MKHLAKVLALVMALALAFGLVACGHEHTAGSEWKSDKTNHWHTCTECDEVMDEAAHTPGEWQIDAESGEHYRVCTVCGYETDRAAHTAGSELKFNSDYTQQWNECTVCGAEMNKTAHTHTADETEWGSDGTNHWRNCSVCGQKVASTEKAHALGEYKSDKTDHWQVCADCGVVVGKEAHVAGEVETDGASDTVKCEDCGYVMSTAAHQHRLGAYESNETNHWQTCETCSQKVGEAAHTAGEWTYDAESGKDVQQCSVCGYQMDEREHVHAYTVWTNDGSGDTVSCVCGEAFEGFAQQKVDLDAQYNSETLEITPNTEKTMEIDLGMFGGISDVTVAMLAYEGDNINMYNRDGKDIQSTFAEGTLTFHVSEFGFAYGDRTIAITFKDEGGTERTVNVPVLLVTKVIMNKTDLDNMTYFSKESEATEALIYGGYFELGADITYSGQFNYVMPSTIDAAKGGFVGVFDGCGYNIDGIEINTVDSSEKWNNYHGMFGSLYGGTVKNVSFTNVVIGVKGSLISAYGSGTIENVYAQFKEMRVNNQLGLAFSHGVGNGGATIKDCVVDISGTSFSLVSGGKIYQFCFFGKQSSWTDPETQKPVKGPKPNLQGAYLIGTLPEGTTTWTDEANSTGTFGKYDSMTAFAEAYNAADSALKAEIDTWDTTYWQVTDGAISFVDKSAA